MANTLNLLTEETFAEMMDEKNAILEAIASKSGDVDISSWAEVQAVVRAGLASRVFSIGDQLVCNHSKYGKITWDIIGIDHDTPVNTEYRHSMTLQKHSFLSGYYMFDAPEPTNPNTNRKNYGSNNWAESNVRQWLNSDGASGSWFEPQTEYDAAPSYASEAGFMKGFDADFLSVIGKVYKYTALNTVTDGGGVQTSKDSFFILSNTEVYGGANGGIEEGKPYAYYKDNSGLSSPGTGADGNRAKYDQNGAAAYGMTRSAATDQSAYYYYIHSAGNLLTSKANGLNAVAPACCIV